MKATPWLVGGALCVGMAVLPAALLYQLPEPTQLSVEIPLAKAYQIRETAAVARIPVRIFPSEPGSRFRVKSIPEIPAPGINLTSYSVEYGHRWLEEVTIPQFVGPFETEQTPTCGMSLRIGPELFDTETVAGKGLKAALLQRLRESFPKQGSQNTPVGSFRYTLPEVSDLRVSLLFEDAKTVLFLKVVLEDQTFVSAAAELSLRAVDGIPSFAPIRKVDIAYGGPSIDRIKNEAIQFGSKGGNDGLAQIFCVADSFLGLNNCKGTAQKIASARLPGAIQNAVKQAINEQFSRLNGQLAAMKRPFSPFPNHPEASLKLRLASEPILNKNGLELSICSSLSLPSQGNSKIVGPVQRVGSKEPPVLSAPKSRSSVLVALDVNQLNQILYFLWQTGMLKELGANPSLIDALPPAVKDLAFTLTGFDPQLPPTVSTEPSFQNNAGLTLILGDVRIGTWEGRQVTSHAVAQLSARSEGEQLEFSAAFPNVAINCIESLKSGGTRLTSCFSDLLPAVRETLGEKPMIRRMAGGEILSALPRLFFEGLRLELSRLSVESDSKAKVLEATVEARIVGEK